MERLEDLRIGDGNQGRPGWRGRLSICLRFVAEFWLDALFALAIFVGQFTLPDGIPTPDLDSSWSQALGECFKTRAQAGIDYIFTYGPLGGLGNVIYDKQMYWHRYGWEWACSLVVTGIVVAFARRLRQKDVRFLFYAAMLLYVVSLSDLRLEFTALALACLLVVSELRVPFLLLSGIVFAALCLVKFTFAAFVLPALVLVTAWKWWETRRLTALVLPVAYGVGLLGIWLATGQALANLPKFMTMSMEIASGYVEAMSVTGSQSLLVRALVIIVIDVLACLVIVLRAKRKRPLLVCLILTLAALHFQFRHSFIRHDEGHCLFFFGFAITFPFVLVVAEPGALNRWLVRLSFGVTLVLALQPFSELNSIYTPNFRRRATELWTSLRNRANAISHPQIHQDELDTMHRRQCDLWQMPKIKSLVGDKTIDMISYSQGLLFLNGLNWTPRPIFQSYSAYTPKLLAVNQDFYRGERAPEFVLFRMSPIDGRLPSTEDSGALMELLRSYRPVMKEKDYLLFQHQKAARPQNGLSSERTTELTIRLGEVVPISSSPKEFLTAAFQFQLRTSGRLLHALYRNPILYVNFRLSDGSFRRYRLVPGLAAHEFLLNPLVEDNDDFVEIYGGKANKRIVALSITQEDFFGLHLYRSDVHLTLKAFPLPFATQLSPSELAPLTRIASLPKG